MEKTESKSKKALDVLIDYYGSLDVVRRELIDHFFAYISLEYFNSIDQESRWRITSNFGWILDYFDALELEN